MTSLERRTIAETEPDDLPWYLKDPSFDHHEQQHDEHDAAQGKNINNNNIRRYTGNFGKDTVDSTGITNRILQEKLLPLPLPLLPVTNTEQTDEDILGSSSSSNYNCADADYFTPFTGSVQDLLYHSKPLHEHGHGHEHEHEQGHEPPTANTHISESSFLVKIRNQLNDNLHSYAYSWHITAAVAAVAVVVVFGIICWTSWLHLNLNLHLHLRWMQSIRQKSNNDARRHCHSHSHDGDPSEESQTTTEGRLEINMKDDGKNKNAEPALVQNCSSVISDDTGTNDDITTRDTGSDAAADVDQLVTITTNAESIVTTISSDNDESKRRTAEMLKFSKDIPAMAEVLCRTTGLNRQDSIRIATQEILAAQRRDMEETRKMERERLLEMKKKAEEGMYCTVLYCTVLYCTVLILIVVSLLGNFFPLIGTCINKL